VDCKAYFISTEGGKTSYLFISVDEISKMSNEFNEDMFAVDYKNQLIFLDLLENKLHKTINYLVDQEEKSEGLFN
jgi:hypothetical protein